MTPSKNVEEYLAEIRRSNEEVFLRSSSEVPETTEEPKPLLPVEIPILVIKDSSAVETLSTHAPINVDSTEPATIPTLSTNPFQAPSDDVTISVIVKHEEDTTTASYKALFEPDSLTAETTVPSTTAEAASSTTAESSTAGLLWTEEEGIIATTQAAIEPATVPTTQEASTTASTTTTAKDDSSEESKESEEEENTVSCAIDKIR